MKFALNFSRPDIIFAIVWLTVLAMYVPLPTMITPPMGAGVAAMLLINIVTAPIIYYMVRDAIERKSGRRAAISYPSLGVADQEIIKRFLFVLMALWSVLWVAGIIYSGGLPVVWYLTGDTREYLDFGIPSVSGLGDMFRCFAATLCILLFLVSRRRFYLWLWLLHLIPAIAQVSRGGIAVFVCQSICMVMMLQKVKFRQVMLGALVILFGGGMFVLLGMLRGIKMSATDYAGVGQYLGAMPVGFYWLWTYIASPWGNVVYAASLGLHPSYVPDYTLVYLVPTVIRQTFFTGHIYTPLTTDELNATSIYSPLIQDFGLAGAIIAVSILLLLASYVHIRARRGNLFFVLLYPSLYSSLVLSFFHIFALTPGVIAVPLVCVWMRNFMRRKHGELHIPSQTVTS